MLRSVEVFIELFRKKGYKITPQRRVIFETLSQDDSHPTAEEIFRRVSAIMPDISRTTVYNTLHEMVAVDALVEVEDLSGEGTRYDVNTDQHHHLFCMSCHTLLDIDRAYKGLVLSPDEAAGYRVVRRQVTFYGYCPTCQGE
ncbi:MAG: Fur family transcriptional regulator [Anaerolineae bacterium]